MEIPNGTQEAPDVNPHTMLNNPYLRYIITLVKAQEQQRGEEGFSAADISNLIDSENLSHDEKEELRRFAEKALPFLSRGGILHHDDEAGRYRVAPRYRGKRRPPTSHRNIPSADYAGDPV